MKKGLITIISVALLGMAIPVVMPTVAKAQPGVSVSIQTFYDELSPYGQWMDYGSYGYAWRPNTRGDFRPYYTGGRWAMTEYGNTWVSDYDWGWAPFHYGRWTYDDYYGWIWIPDTEWGPAWVTWRDNGSYYGWAPMAGIMYQTTGGYLYHVLIYIVRDSKATIVVRGIILLS
jgi:hypothetical protein